MDDQMYCFICDEAVNKKGVQLSTTQTPYSKTGLPTKISQIMGEKFMVVFTVDDVICHRCSTLMNQCDKLETDLGEVQKTLTGYLNKKYNLLQDTDDINPKDSIEVIGDEDSQNAPSDAFDVNEDANVPSTVAINVPLASVSKKAEPHLYRCSSCNFITSHHPAFLVHYKKCKKLCYKCSMCDKKFENPQQIRRHIMEAHLSNWPCHFCGTTFSDQAEYTSHMKIHLSSSTYNPPKMQTDQNLHQNQNGNYECNVCLFNTKHKAIFYEHIRKHAAKIFKCRKCNIKFETKTNLEQHMKSHTTKSLKSIAWKCSICTRSFKNENDLKDHVTSHNEFAGEVSQTDGNLELTWGNLECGEENQMIMEFHRCHTCSLAFVDLNVLNHHLKTHEDAGKSVIGDLGCGVNGITNCSNYDNEDNLDEMLDIMHSDISPQFRNLVAEENKSEGMPYVESINTSIHLNNMPQLTSDTEETDIGGMEMNHDNSQVNENNSASTSEQASNSNNIFEMVRVKKLSSTDLNTYGNIQLMNYGDIQTSDDNDGVTIVIPRITDPATESAEITTYGCALCSFQTSDEDDLKNHFVEHQDIKSYVCSICGRKLSSSQKLTSHLKSHQKHPGSLICPYCTDEFSDKFHMQLHVREKHQQEKAMLTCKYCSEQFPSKKGLQNHEESHPESFSLQCETCNQLFSKEKQLRDHIALEHRDPHCRFCNKEILKPKTLKTHEQRHMRGVENYICPICARSFKTKTGFRHHSAVHTGKYTYFCTFCPRGFMSRMMLEEHKSKHTKEERYVCDICGKKFSFQSTYWIHRRWHVTPYPYKCSYCNRMFRHSSLLAVHKRKHTGERPYKCPHCPLSFPVGGTLKRHLILHTGVYPYNCETCGRGFTTKHKFVAHRVKVHEEVELLNDNPETNKEYRMVIRDQPNDDAQQPGDLLDWEVETEDNEQVFMFKTGNNVDTDYSEIILQDSDQLIIPCTVITGNELVDDMGNSQMVQIVLDDETPSTASASDEPDASMLSDLWSYQ